MSEGVRLNWRPPGPVSAAFFQSTAAVQAIQGPIGSAKTTTNLFKHVHLATRQAPSTRDGVRKYKLVVVREDYRSLWRSLIPSWLKWMPKEGPGIEWIGGRGEPATHSIRFIPADGVPIEFVIEFAALGEHRVEDFMRGYEPTAWYLNELDLLPADTLTYALGRAGRYPAMTEGGPSWAGVTCDFNAPEDDSPIYELFHVKRPESWDFFVQPGGVIETSPGVFEVNDLAENLENLPADYYATAMAGQASWYVRRFLANKAGQSRKGMPVFPEYADHLHLSPVELKPVEGLPLRIGGDAGRTPAAIIGQRMPSGQWRIYDEILATNMGARSFGELVNKVLRERYPGFDAKSIKAWGDPSAAFKPDTDDYSWLEVMGEVTGFSWLPAPVANNSIAVRLEVVRHALTRTFDGGTPGLLLSPRCPVLRRGFNSGYRYAKFTAAGGGDRYQETPEKNDASHPHDGLQYLLLGEDEYAEVLNRRRDRGEHRRQTRAIDEDHPRGEWRGRGGDRDGGRGGGRGYQVAALG